MNIAYTLRNIVIRLRQPNTISGSSLADRSALCTRMDTDSPTSDLTASLTVARFFYMGENHSWDLGDMCRPTTCVSASRRTSVVSRDQPHD